MYILGISAFYHDSAACLLKNGEIIAAAQEERFTRIKFDESFPKLAINFCLNQAKIDGHKIDAVIFYEKPFLKFERLLETYLSFAPKGFSSFSKSMPLWIKDKLFQKSFLIKELGKHINSNIDWGKRLLFSEHHLSHAGSAFFPSPFKNAAVLTLDGVGEWTTTSLSIGNGKELNIIKELNFPHSLGLLYSAFTYYTGFKVNSGEYKVMGLAPYGEPKYVDIIKNNLINIANDGTFQINMDYFDYATGLTMTNNKFNNLFGGKPRKSYDLLSQKEMDLAASIQKVVEEIIEKLVKNISQETGENNLCLAGGVALNCVANGIIMKKKYFKNIWIQPAAGDSGGALGAALCAWHLHFKKDRKIYNNKDLMKGSLLGPEFKDKIIEFELSKCGANYERLSNSQLIKRIVDNLSNEKVIGWMQGRMEFGPRALGSRSIIADPRSSKMQKLLNLKIKYRESFRPFAPSILSEKVNEWFDIDQDSPYMLLVTNLKKDKCIKMTKKERSLFGIEKLNISRSKVPAITHVDYSARVQTVHKDTNPMYHSLIDNFYKKTGCPILVNTSFNIRSEPIVCSPIDAFKCFMGTELDILVIGNYILYKENQNQLTKKNINKIHELT